jgi:hypothetical protein
VQAQRDLSLARLENPILKTFSLVRSSLAGKCTERNARREWYATNGRRKNVDDEGPFRKVVIISTISVDGQKGFLEFHEKHARLNRFLRTRDDTRHPSLKMVANRLDNEFDGLVDGQKCDVGQLSRGSGPKDSEARGLVAT